jgi:hypothetical protein
VLPELARKVQNAFRRLVGADHITLSAGIAISHSNTPLYQLAETARTALDEQAKGHKWYLNGQPREKDAISFLQTPMGWGEFERVYGAFQQVCQMVQGSDGKPPLPRALITRLASIATLYQRNATHVRQQLRATAHNRAELTFYARWLWRGMYHLTRFAERHKEWHDDIIAIRNQLNDRHSGLIEHLHVIARWAELYTRSSKEG